MTSVGNRSSVARDWDGFDAYLFDIDGTLLHCSDAVHYFAFCEVLSSLAGRPLNLDGVTAHGNTDIGILRDALYLAGVQEDEWRPQLPEIRALMGRFVAERRNEMCAATLPCVAEVLEHLRFRGAVLGVATGNLERIGTLKLSHCGLLGSFDFGGYSDEHEYRRDVFSGALAQARSLAGEGAAVCVVGDTPEDVRAARANGLNVIAVATGVYSAEELLTEDPDWCIRSFRELLAVNT